MNLLAIDTSTEIASLALMVGETFLSERQESPKTHAQFILPIIDRLLVDAGVSLTQLDGIIFGCGPGSFTGLRIACSIAKGLAYGSDLSLIPVSTLAAIAWEARTLKGNAHSPVLAVLDARMQELYWSYFDKETVFADAQVNAPKDLFLPESESIILAGLGIDEYWDQFPSSIQSQIAHKLRVYPSAESMIRLVQNHPLPMVSIAEAQPIYVRNQVTQGAARG